MASTSLKSSFELLSAERCLVDRGSGRRIQLTPTQAHLASLLIQAPRTADELQQAFVTRGVPLDLLDIEEQLDALRKLDVLADELSLDAELGLTRRAPEVPVPSMQPLALEPADPVPTLRQDLKTRKVPSRQGLIEVEDPTSGKRFTLYDFEVSIARMLNGTRTVSEVVGSASRLGIPITIESFRKFIRQLQIYGFVAAAGSGNPSPGPAEPRTFAPRDQWDPGMRELFISGVRMLRLNRLDEAKNYFAALLEIQPQNLEAQEMLGLVELKLATGAGPTTSATLSGDELVPAETREEAPSEQLVGPREEIDAPPKKPSLLVPILRRWTARLVVLGLIGGAMMIRVPLNVAADCQLIPLERDVVRASSGGFVRESFVTQGQWVEKGFVVAQMASGDVEKQLERREAEVAQAQSQLELVMLGARPEEIGRSRAALAGRNEAWEMAKKDYERIRDLYDRKHASLEELTKAEERSASQRALVVEAGAQLRLIQAGARPQEINKSKAELRARIADRAMVSAELKAAVLVAPIAGLVTTANVKEKVGIHLDPGAVFCEIEDVRTMRVVAKVAENDLDLVEKGQPTSIKVANLPSRIFEGQVTFISPIVEEDPATGARFFRIESVIKNDEGVLKPNLSGFAKVHAGDRRLGAVITRGLVRWLRLRFLF